MLILQPFEVFIKVKLHECCLESGALISQVLLVVILEYLAFKLVRCQVREVALLTPIAFLRTFLALLQKVDVRIGVAALVVEGRVDLIVRRQIVIAVRTFIVLILAIT